MRRKTITKKRKELFNRNFDKKAYEKVRAIIQDAIAKADSFIDLWKSLYQYDRDNFYDEDYSMLTCGVELDRSNMATDANYVGVEFLICWDDEVNRGGIGAVKLYSSDTKDKEVKQICTFDPKTCEIMDWLYH